MKTYVCVGIPDEENMYHGHHTRRETWECQASSEDEAQEKAFEHFYYFHEVLVYEKVNLK